MRRRLSLPASPRTPSAVALSPPCTKRDRDARVEKERLLQLRSSSSAGSVQQQQNHDGVAEVTPLGNHVPPDKVAFERHLLLGDPDWSNRTIADRNTLPRKKEQCSGSASPPDEVYYSSNKSPIPPPPATGDGCSTVVVVQEEQRR